ncbi:class I SAM-dependent methyltransferase [Cohnella boryungensis]
MEMEKNENRKNWDDRTKIHEKSSFYDVQSFLKGRCSLLPLEKQELGDLSGRTMLHLQCHFGQDSLSWARRGVKVTGVDFSEEAIRLARSLNDDLGLDARFVCSDVYAIPEALPDERFDVVYTSYGVLCWLPDLTQWARIIRQKLKPGGLFYIAEQHPVADRYEADEGVLRPCYSYFEDKALRFESDTTYASDGTEPPLNHKVTYEWQHPMGKIVTALIEAGLRIVHLHEFPYCMYEKYPGCMVRDEDGWWRLRDEPALPLLFSIKAVNPE